MSRHSSAGHDPLHWMAGDLGNEVVVAVVVQERDLFPLSDNTAEVIPDSNLPALSA
jgi:hypothetical protein